MDNEIAEIRWSDLDKTRYYIYGPSLFFGVRALVYPSTLVKTRLQMQSPTSTSQYRGTIDAFRQIVSKEGVRGLYKGFGANALNIITGNFYITAYEITKSFLREHDSVFPQQHWWISGIAGGVASMISQTAVVPLDIVSQKMMMTNMDSPSGARHGISSIVKDIWKSQGIRGFYRGYFVSIATHMPSSSIWWGFYGALYPGIYNACRLRQAGNGDDVQTSSKSTLVFSQAMGGGIAGVITAILTNPMDIIRTRTQLDNRSPMETLRFLLKQDGPSGLMRGVNARMIAMAQSGVLVISTYELVKRLSHKDL